jgi:hypothetical protein
MKSDEVQLTTPTLFVMSEGEVVFKRVGLMMRDELIESFDEAGVE